MLALIAAAALQPAWARHGHGASDAEPGAFDYYLLSLSWSPAFCLQSPDAEECSGPRRYGFVVHGLWPQNETGWPEYCDSHAHVPDRALRQISDLMPARKLIYHEWSAHGSCSGLDPEDFFALVRRAYDAVAIPAALTAPGAAIERSPAAIVDAFLRDNPRFPMQSIVVTCSSQDTPRLRELHVCLDRELHARDCPAEALREGCRAASIMVPPVR